MNETKAGLKLIADLDYSREHLSKPHYTDQLAAQQDALAFALVFIVKPAIRAIEEEARADAHAADR